MLLIDLLQTPAYTGLSDADALALASIPILTPRPDRITADSLAAILGGPAGAAVYNGIVALTQSTTPQIAGFARYALAVLGGKGFDPANPEASTIAGTLVAAGACTSQQAALIFNTISYPTGDAPPTLEAIQAARAQMARQAAFASLLAAADAEWEPVNTLHNHRGIKINTLLENGGDVPENLAALDAVAG